MTSQPTTPTEDSGHTGTEAETTVTVTMTIMIRAAPPITSNNNNDYSEDISATTPPSDILFYENMNGWSPQSYIPPFQPSSMPPATTVTSTVVRGSSAEEPNEFSTPPHSLLMDFPLYPFPPFIPFPLYTDGTPEDDTSYIISSPITQADTALTYNGLLANHYSDRLSPELIPPLYTTAITSMITTAPVQRATNNISYSSLLTDPFDELASSPLVSEEDNENQEVPAQQEDVYNLNEMVEDEQ